MRHDVAVSGRGDGALAACGGVWCVVCGVRRVTRAVRCVLCVCVCVCRCDVLCVVLCALWCVALLLANEPCMRMHAAATYGLQQINTYT